MDLKLNQNFKTIVWLLFFSLVVLCTGVGAIGGTIYLILTTPPVAANIALSAFWCIMMLFGTGLFGYFLVLSWKNYFDNKKKNKESNE